MSKPLDQNVNQSHRKNSRPTDVGPENLETQDAEFNSGEQALPNDTFNNNLSAIPKSTLSGADVGADSDITDQVDFGEMNELDARDSGYTDRSGRAISKAKEDVVGSPTGAYTDIGAGRSSAVHHHDSDKDRHH